MTNRTARAPLQKCLRPLRSLKLEHAEFTRLVIAPRGRDRNLTASELEARRMAAAWRTIRAAQRKHSPANVMAFARWMSGAWLRYQRLPDCPPSFEFDEVAAVRMALDAELWR